MKPIARALEDGEPRFPGAAVTAAVAVVDDDPELGDFLQVLLKSNGFMVALYPSPGRFLDSLGAVRPDLVVLDMQLPGMDGREVIRVLRSNPQTRGVFIIAISGEQRKTSDVVSGLQVGADEYLLKPLDSDMLLARIQALLRRGPAAPSPEEELRAGSLAVLLESRQVRLNGREVRMTRLEFDLLVYFLRNSNRVLTRGLILQSVWGSDPGLSTRTVDKHVESLRRKLGAGRIHIETVVRVGYMLKL